MNWRKVSEIEAMAYVVRVWGDKEKEDYLVAGSDEWGWSVIVDRHFTSLDDAKAAAKKLAEAFAWRENWKRQQHDLCEELFFHWREQLPDMSRKEFIESDIFRTVYFDCTRKAFEHVPPRPDLEHDYGLLATEAQYEARPTTCRWAY